MLYIAPIVKEPGAKRYGYANDIFSAYIGRNLRETTAAAKVDYDHMLTLGEELGSPFNAEKTEI